jgi:phasin
MTTSTKTKSASHTVQFRDTIEAGAERSKEALETFNAAANEAAHAVQDCCSTALKGMQDYSGKVAEFTQANIKSYVEFLQKLASVKSPSEFIEVSTSHTRYQLETLAEQGKELAALGQQVTIDAVEPLKTGFAKAPIVPR